MRVKTGISSLDELMEEASHRELRARLRGDGHWRVDLRNQYVAKGSSCCRHSHLAEKEENNMIVELGIGFLTAGVMGGYVVYWRREQMKWARIREKQMKRLKWFKRKLERERQMKKRS